MSQAASSCPKCQGEMVRGYVRDRSHQLDFFGEWVKGVPKSNTWFQGLFTGLGINVPKAADLIPIGTFRCQSCGFLESYAREEFAAKSQ